MFPFHPKDILITLMEKYGIREFSLAICKLVFLMHDVLVIQVNKAIKYTMTVETCMQLFFPSLLENQKKCTMWFRVLNSSFHAEEKIFYECLMSQE